MLDTADECCWLLLACCCSLSDTQRLCTILKEQRIILEQLRLPKHTSQCGTALRSSTPCPSAAAVLMSFLLSLCLCTAVAVQGWAGQPTVYVQVSSYDELLAQVCLVFPASSAAPDTPAQPLLACNFTLYFVPPGFDACAPFSSWFHVRQKVGSESEWTRYLCSFPALARHPLLLWQRRAAADDACGAAASAAVGSSAKVPSPTKDEAPVQLPSASSTAIASPPSLGSPSVQSGSSGRSSTDQKPFAEAVYRRDGHKCVVADCATSPVQAAHIVPVREERSAEAMQAAELLSLYEPQNGISLCVSCHDYLDAGVSDAVDRTAEDFNCMRSQSLTCCCCCCAVPMRSYGTSIRRARATCCAWQWR